MGLREKNRLANMLLELHKKGLIGCRTIKSSLEKIGKNKILMSVDDIEKRLHK